MRLTAIILLISAVCCFAYGKSDIEKWESFSADDLALTDNPAEKGAKAMYLFRRAEVVNTGRSGSLEYRITFHGAIKVFTDAGKDLANVELPDNVKDIKARTVSPDGKAVEISKSDIMKKVITKRRGSRDRAKIFAFPDVAVGSILEFVYSARFEEYQYLVFSWPFQEDIFCRISWIEFEKDILKPYNRFTIDTFKQTDIQMLEMKDRVRYTAFDVPALPDEDFTPPRGELVPHFLMYVALQEVKGARSLDLKTAEGRDRYADLFWEQLGEEGAESLYDFMKSKKAVPDLAQSILDGDSRGVAPEQKIYEYVAANFRNTDYVTISEEERSAQTKKEKRKTEKTNYSVENVIKNGYGDRDDITLLCTALLRAAGLEAYPVYACGRDDGFFQKGILLDQFHEPLLAVKGGDGLTFLDPGKPYCPFGQVAWEKQGVTAMLFHPERSEFINVPVLDGSTNRISRTVDVTFDDKGITGSLRLEYSGNPAITKKNYYDDESAEELRDFVEEYLEVNFDDVELTSHEFVNLRERDKNLVVTAEFTVPDYAAGTRTRLMFKPSLLGKTQNRFFTSDQRVFPVCFHYPYIVEDEITFHLPEGYGNDEPPKPVRFANQAGTYQISFQPGTDTLVCRRTFQRNGIMIGTPHYPTVKAFFEMVRKGDETTAVLKKKE